MSLSTAARPHRKHPHTCTNTHPNPNTQHINSATTHINTEQQCDTHHNQRTLHGHKSNDDNTAYGEGDNLHAKNPNTIRIVSQNLHFLPQSEQHHKSQQLFNFVKEKNVDILLATEPNLNPTALHEKALIPARCKLAHLNKPSSILAHNTHEQTKEPKQMGGTLIISTKEATCRKTQQGRDKSNLGRWTWINIQGRAQYNTKIISAYRPHQRGDTENTIVAQQERYWRTKRETRTARQKFDKDLIQLLRKWTEQGDQIILGMDNNEDVRNSTLTRAMMTLGMREVILEKHRKHQAPPATYNRGNDPIDGIWCTPGITPIRAGYTSFQQFYDSDHRMLWVDVTKQDILGHNPPGIYDVNPRRLQPHDPRNRNKYIKITKKAFKQHKVTAKLQALQQAAQQPDNLPKIKKLYDELSTLTKEIRQTAATKTRKFRMGAVPYSPTYKKHLEIKTSWELLRKRKKRVRVAMKKVKRLATRYNLLEGMRLPLEAVEVKYKEACKTLYTVKRKEAQAHRKKHLKPLAEAKAKEGNVGL